MASLRKFFGYEKYLDEKNNIYLVRIDFINGEEIFVWIGKWE